MVSTRWEAPFAIRDICREQAVPVALIALLVPALALSLAAAGAGALTGDVSTTLFLQSHLPGEASGLFETMNVLGDTGGALLVTTVIGFAALVLRQPVAAALVFLTVPLRMTNALLKVIFESPRPNDTLVSVSEVAHGFGFPSGHTMGATLLYGTLFLVAPRLTARQPLLTIIRAGALAMIVLAGISRIYVGAHWPSDVVGGYLWASILLLAVTLLDRRWSGIRSRD